MDAYAISLRNFLNEQLSKAEGAIGSLATAMREREYQKLLDGAYAAASILDQWREQLEARLRKEVRSKKWRGTAEKQLLALQRLVAKESIRPDLRTLLTMVGMMRAGRDGVSGTQLVHADLVKIATEIVAIAEKVEVAVAEIQDTLETLIDGLMNPDEKGRSSGRESEASSARPAQVHLLLPPEHDETA
ncbi:hypothetical protein [Streptomyces sp. SAS_276]|uniref:hypothetical protein n=1 Tax=Streptomyces sp. SAS_276 TaxID=3412745 RepID=UPI00403C7536